MNEREIIAKEWRDDNGILHRREVGRELIRCKECKWHHYDTDDECRWRIEEIPKDDDFCSRGERRE